MVEESASSEFRSREEFHEVLDRVLRMVADNPELGGRLRALEVRQCFRFPDMDVSVQVRPDDSGGLEWTFAGREDWRPEFELTMDSGVANRFFQGAENAAIAIARGRIKVSCDSYGAVLRAFPANRQLVQRYRELVEREYPHLVVAPERAAQPVPAA